MTESRTGQYVLIAELSDDDTSHGLESFGPYPDRPTDRDIEAVYQWARKKGYRRDRYEVEVHIAPILTLPAPAVAPPRLALVHTSAGEPAAARK